MTSSNSSDDSEVRLVNVFKPSERKTNGANLWEDLRTDVPAWKDLQYEWIGQSCFFDQIILTSNSPIHQGSAVYVMGPDIAGPRSTNPNWPEDLLYLGSSVEEWLDRMKRFGDEYSIAPGSIDDDVNSPDEYRKIYRELNPGLQW